MKILDAFIVAAIAIMVGFFWASLVNAHFIGEWDAFGEAPMPYNKCVGQIFGQPTAPGHSTHLLASGPNLIIRVDVGPNGNATFTCNRETNMQHAFFHFRETDQ